MTYKTLVPTHLVPIGELQLSDVKLTEQKPAEIHNDQGMHISRVLEVEGEPKAVNDWLFFHSLLDNTMQPLDYHENIDKYKIVQLADTDTRMPTEEYREKMDDITRYIYHAKVDTPLAYADAYEKFVQCSEQLKNSIKSYFLAESIRSHTARIRSVNLAYWQVTMYVSIMETVLGDPPRCEGEPECEICGKNMGGHYKTSTNAWIKQELLDHVRNDTVRAQYKRVIEVARNAIRHKSIHEGLMPEATYPKLADGKYTYDIGIAVRQYRNDTHAETALLKGLRELVRYLLLSRVLSKDVFPELKGFDVQTISVNITGKSRIIASGEVKK